MAAARLPYLINYSPEIDEVVASSGLQFQLIFSQNINPAVFSSDVSRPNYFILVDTTNGQSLPTTYVGYSASSYTVTLAPSSTLSSNRTYRVVVREGVEDTYGRKTPAPTTWSFSTSGNDLTIQEPIYPQNYFSTNQAVEYSWPDVAGAINYHWQFDTEITFSAPVTSVITTSPYTQEILSPGLYYWRVRSITDTATGDWTDPRAILFINSEIIGLNDPLNSVTPSVVFGSEYSFKGNLPSFPVINISFTTSVSSNVTLAIETIDGRLEYNDGAFVDWFEVTKTKVLPRNDLTGEYLETVVLGRWVISSDEKVVTFTPTEAIEENTKYTVKVLKGLSFNNGAILTQDQTTSFTSSYNPLYSGIRLLQSRLGFAADYYPEDYLYYHLHIASLEANLRYLAGQGWDMTYIDEDTVRDQNPTGHAVVRWVEAAARYNIICTMLNENLSNIGRSTRLGDYTESLDRDFLAAIKEAKELAREDMENWASALENLYGYAGKAFMNANWHDDFWNYNMYVGDFWKKY